jgi:hypothetical protein
VFQSWCQRRELNPRNQPDVKDRWPNQHSLLWRFTRRFLDTFSTLGVESPGRGQAVTFFCDPVRKAPLAAVPKHCLRTAFAAAVSKERVLPARGEPLLAELGQCSAVVRTIPPATVHGGYSSTGKALHISYRGFQLAQHFHLSIRERHRHLSASSLIVARLVGIEPAISRETVGRFATQLQPRIGSGGGNRTPRTSQGYEPGLAPAPRIKLKSSYSDSVMSRQDPVFPPGSCGCLMWSRDTMSLQEKPYQVLSAVGSEVASIVF